MLFLVEPIMLLCVVSKQNVRCFPTGLASALCGTCLLATYRVGGIERLCRRLVVIDHGRVVHDGTIEALHARYGSRRRVVVDLDEPLAAPLEVPGVTVEAVEADGHRMVFALAGAGAGEVVARLAQVAALRDISVVEPDIEEVVARLYAAPPPPVPR